MNLKSKIGGFREGINNFSKTKIKKKYKRCLSIALAGILASAMMFTSFSRNVSAITVEDIEQKYSSILEATTLSLDDVKDVGYADSRYYVLKADGSVISTATTAKGVPTEDSVKEVYPAGSIDSYIHINSNNIETSGFILKHTNGEYSVLGKADYGLLGFDTSKKITNIELTKYPNTFAYGIAIYYEDGTVNFRGVFYGTVVNVTVSNLKKIYTSERHNFAYFLFNDGTVKGIGQSPFGQLGIEGDTATLVDVPVTGVEKIYLDSYNALFVLDNGDIVGLGDSEEGQLGNETRVNTSPVMLPVKYNELDDIYIASDTIFFLYKDGTIKGLGDSTYGVLGILSSKNSSLVELPISNVDEMMSNGEGAEFLIGDELYGLGGSLRGQFGKYSTKTLKPLKIDGSYSKIKDMNSTYRTDGSVSFRYITKDKVGQVYEVVDFKGDVPRGSTYIDMYLTTDKGFIFSPSTYDLTEYNKLGQPVDSLIYAVNDDLVFYKSTKGQLIAASDILRNGSFSITGYMEEVNNYFTVLKYLELAELSLDESDIAIAKEALDKIPIGKTYKKDLTAKFDSIQTAVQDLGKVAKLIDELEVELSETKYNEAVELLASLDSDSYKEQQKSLKARLDVVKVSIDDIINPINSALSDAEKTLDWHDYRRANILVSKLTEGFSISKPLYVSRLSAIYDEALSRFEEYCDTLVSKAEKSKLQVDIDNAYNEVILLPLSSKYRNGFLTRLGIGGITVPPTNGGGDTDIPGDGGDTNNPGGDNTTPPDGDNNGGVVTPPDDSNQGSISSSDSVKNDIIRLLSDVSTQVDNSPNATKISQMRLNLSMASSGIDGLKDDDVDKAVLQARHLELSSKVDEVANYYSNAFSKAELMVSGAEASKDRLDVVSAYKYVRRLPEGIQKAGLLDRLDLIKVN